MLLADVHLSDIIWTTIMIFFMVMYLMILFSIFGDIFRSHDMGGFAKAIWVLFIFVFLFLGPFIYLIVRGSGMAQRSMDAQAEAQQQVQAYAQQVVGQSGGGSATDQIASAKALLDAGTISQAEFDALKAKALA